MGPKHRPCPPPKPHPCLHPVLHNQGLFHFFCFSSSFLLLWFCFTFQLLFHLYFYFYIFSKIAVSFLVEFYLFFTLLLFSVFCFCFLAAPCSLWERGSWARGCAKASAVGAPSPTTGLTENLRPQGIFIRVRSPGGPHLSTKTQLYPTAYKLQCWKPQAKQPVRQEHNPIH